MSKPKKYYKRARNAAHNRPIQTAVVVSTAGALVGGVIGGPVGAFLGWSAMAGAMQIGAWAAAAVTPRKKRVRR